MFYQERVRTHKTPAGTPLILTTVRVKDRKIGVDVTHFQTYDGMGNFHKKNTHPNYPGQPKYHKLTGGLSRWDEYLSGKNITWPKC